MESKASCPLEQVESLDDKLVPAARSRLTSLRNDDMLDIGKAQLGNRPWLLVTAPLRIKYCLPR